MGGAARGAAISLSSVSCGTCARKLFEALTLLRREVARQDDLNPREQVAGALALEPWHPFARQAKDLAVLCFRWDREQHTFTIWHGDGRLAAQDRRVEWGGRVGQDYLRPCAQKRGQA